jgi:hypothetical protein
MIARPDRDGDLELNVSGRTPRQVRISPSRGRSSGLGAGAGAVEDEYRETAISTSATARLKCLLGNLYIRTPRTGLGVDASADWTCGLLTRIRSARARDGELPLPKDRRSRGRYPTVLAR